MKVAGYGFGFVRVGILLPLLRVVSEAGSPPNSVFSSGKARGGGAGTEIPVPLPVASPSVTAIGSTGDGVIGIPCRIGGGTLDGTFSFAGVTLVVVSVEIVPPPPTPGGLFDGGVLTGGGPSGTKEEVPLTFFHLPFGIS